ncbi:unnamed protein product [Blepharisma stoltei]|uniref:Uncharacterized protein n=1 Tax=Blepharisma stoltei TaxID=1481888 RepID=A0AAU9J1I1_9CILI|nr:unnamed protein product [Blepharisma stoltei]
MNFLASKILLASLFILSMTCIIFLVFSSYQNQNYIKISHFKNAFDIDDPYIKESYWLNTSEKSDIENKPINISDSLNTQTNPIDHRNKLNDTQIPNKIDEKIKSSDTFEIFKKDEENHTEDRIEQSNKENDKENAEFSVGDENIPQNYWSLAKSLMAWNDDAIDSINTGKFEMSPDISSFNNVSCVPDALGINSADSVKFYNPNITFKKCNDGNPPFMWLEENNSLVMNCTDEPKYALGSPPENEVLGLPIAHRNNWIPYMSPVDIGNTEYVYGRCGGIHQSILKNRRSETAADRAKNIASQIKSSLNLKHVRPLTVVYILIDSVSRYHFYRSLPKTIDFLNTDLVYGKYKNNFVGYDFIINNAIGGNTPPNMETIIYGHNKTVHDKLLDKANPRRWYDKPKFDEVQKEAIWRIFENYGFVTAMGYETVWEYASTMYGRYVYTDHRIFNFITAGSPLFRYKDNTEKQRCYGTKDLHRHLFEYTIDFIDNYSEINKFIYLHLSEAHEMTGTVIRTVDSDLIWLLSSIFERFNAKTDEDVVILLGSDHGLYSSNWDDRFESTMENHLPFQFLFANKKIISRLGPHTNEILRKNTQRIVGRFDWFLTLRQLAVTPYTRLTDTSFIYNEWKQNIPASNAHSVFVEKSLDNRTCSELDTTENHCSCPNWKNIDKNDEEKYFHAKTLIDLGMNLINAQINKTKASHYCESLSFKEVIEMKFLNWSDTAFIKLLRYKIIIHVNEDKNALFKIYGQISNSKDLQKEDETHPVIQTPFYSSIDYAQLRKIERINFNHNYCNQIGKEHSIDEGWCICSERGLENFFKNDKLVNQYLRTKTRFSINVGSKSSSCETTCNKINKGCENLEFALLNSKKFLQEYWLDYVTNDKDYIIIKEAKKEINSDILGVENKAIHIFSNPTFSCKVSKRNVRPICPCA